MKTNRVTTGCLFLVLLAGLGVSCGDSGGAKDAAASDAKADAKDGAATDAKVDTAATDTATDKASTDSALPDGSGSDAAKVDAPVADVPAADGATDAAAADRAADVASGDTSASDATASDAPKPDAAAADTAPADAAATDTATADATVDQGTPDVPAPTYAIGGTISGLTSGGLVLRNNGGNDLTVAAGATSFVFTTRLPGAAPYAVTVFTQPSAPAQVCTVASGTGTVGAANVTSVAITCTTPTTPTFTIGGTISGLTGAGLILRNNGGDNLAVLAGSTSFVFATPLAGGAAYTVSVLNQPSPPTQVCTVVNGTGTVAAANVTTVAITCVTQTFTVGGTISGLTGTGLVLRNSGGNDLTVAANATSFTFSAPVASGATYLVTVATAPNTPTQICTVANASGTVGAVNVTSVAVTCAAQAFTIGGSVAGLTGSGLVLQNSGGDNLSVAAAATSFLFPVSVASGGNYAVTVLTQPSTQTCSVATGSGTVGGANVTTPAVTCVDNSYTVGGTIVGLAGTGLVLRNNGGDNRTVTAGATSFTFATSVANGAAYAVTVLTNPSSPTQTCAVTAGTGTIASANVTNVVVTCTTTSFTVGGTISGLTGTGLVLRNNGGNDRTVAAGATTFAFSTSVPSGGAYAVTVLTQPTSPTQICTVVGGTGSGTVGAANVASVMISCVTTSFTVGGSVTGLTATGLVLRNNGGDNLTVAANATNFTFATSVAGAGAYAVTVFTQPTGQFCRVTAGSGTVGAANVTTVAIACLDEVTVCGVAKVGTGDAFEGGISVVTCPTGQVVGSVTFASFGNYTGTCQSYVVGSCHAANSVQVVSDACLGLATCEVPADYNIAPPTGLGDPCPGTSKHLAIQVICH
jgi:environmental stress-induced protein Ves